MMTWRDNLDKKPNIRKEYWKILTKQREWCRNMKQISREGILLAFPNLRLKYQKESRRWKLKKEEKLILKLEEWDRSLTVREKRWVGLSTSYNRTFLWKMSKFGNLNKKYPEKTEKWKVESNKISAESRFSILLKSKIWLSTSGNLEKKTKSW